MHRVTEKNSNSSKKNPLARVVSIPDEFWTGYLSDMSLENYHFSNRSACQEWIGKMQKAVAITLFTEFLTHLWVWNKQIYMEAHTHMHTCRNSRPLEGTVLVMTHLVLSGTGKPSKVHTNCGGGLPVATHFSEMAGPGCTVCSVNQYSSSGLASKTQKDSCSLFWYFNY